MLTDPNTTVQIADAIRLIQKVRAYAKGLGLNTGGHYTSFTPWPGDRIITVLIATKYRDISPHAFYFPIVGKVPYKGFFNIKRAEKEADALRARGFDVCILPVPAYSTLGWFNDPLTEPMTKLSHFQLVETVFHELVHATLYVDGDSDFNEGLATFIGQEAMLRFYRSEGYENLARDTISDSRLLSRRLEKFRGNLKQLYASSTREPELNDKRTELEEGARADIAVLPFNNLDGQQLSRQIKLNDACQAISGTYERDLSKYENILISLGNDLKAFLRMAQEAANETNARVRLLSLE